MSISSPPIARTSKARIKRIMKMSSLFGPLVEPPLLLPDVVPALVTGVVVVSVGVAVVVAVGATVGVGVAVAVGVTPGVGVAMDTVKG
jgi:hypothetical protein